jgi:hypothetical protein
MEEGKTDFNLPGLIVLGMVGAGLGAALSFGVRAIGST